MIPWSQISFVSCTELYGKPPINQHYWLDQSSSAPVSFSSATRVNSFLHSKGTLRRNLYCTHLVRIKSRIFQAYRNSVEISLWAVLQRMNIKRWRRALHLKVAPLENHSPFKTQSRHMRGFWNSLDVTSSCTKNSIAFYISSL